MARDVKIAGNDGVAVPLPGANALPSAAIPGQCLFENAMIQDQCQIFERAAIAAGEFQKDNDQQQLLNPKQTNQILSAMRDAKLGDADPFTTVIQILNHVQQDFVSQYGAGYAAHSYFKALDEIRANIETFVRNFKETSIAQNYWRYKATFKLSLPAVAKSQGGQQFKVEGKYDGLEKRDDKSLFNSLWLGQQREQFIIATRKAGEYEEGRLLNADQTGAILNALRDAKAEGNVIETLAKAINAWQHTFEAKVGNNQHPYSVALNTVKTNIADILATYNPAEGFAKIYHDALSTATTAADTAICNARLERCGDVCMIWACLVWCPIQYSVFCCNFFTWGRSSRGDGWEWGPKSAVYKNDCLAMFCAPYGTMALQCEDFSKQGDVIDKEKTKLNTMMLR